MLVLGALAVTIAVGVWFVFLRSSGPSSTFVAASQEFVAAEQRVEAASAEIERFLELGTFEEEAARERAIMEERAAVFQRLADEEDGEAARLAEEAVAASGQVLAAFDDYVTALVERRLSDSARAVTPMQAGTATLERLATEWNDLA